MSEAHVPPDTWRDEGWIRRKGNWKKKKRRSKSVTDDDVDELRGCIDLGYRFESSPDQLDHRLSLVIPALTLYNAVMTTTPPSSTAVMSDSDSSPYTAIFDCGDNPQTVKTRLRQWAQVVACAVRQSSS